MSIGRSGVLGDASRFASINKRLDLPRAPYVCAIAYFDASMAAFITPDASTRRFKHDLPHLKVDLRRLRRDLRHVGHDFRHSRRVWTEVVSDFQNIALRDPDFSVSIFVTPDAIDVRSNATSEGTDARDETPRASFTPVRTE